jgi:hypothetical protein
MRTIGGHHPCLIIADGDAPEAEAILFAGEAPVDSCLLVQEVADSPLTPRADLLLLREGEITNRPLIETCARSGVPVLLCTRGSTLKEISRAVGWFQLAFRGGAEASPSRRVQVHGGGRLVLLHGGANLRAMGRMHEQTMMPVGYAGAGPADLAVAAGACVLLLPEAGFEQAVKAVRKAEQSLGESKLPPAPDLSLRRAVVAARDLKQGHELALGDMVFHSPAPVEGGFAPYEAEGLVGRGLLRDVQVGEPILSEMLEGKPPEPPPWFSPRPPRERPDQAS